MKKKVWQKKMLVVVMVVMGLTVGIFGQGNGNDNPWWSDDGTIPNLQEQKVKYQNFTVDDLKKEKEEVKQAIENFKSQPKQGMRRFNRGKMKGILKLYKDIYLLEKLHIKDPKTELTVYKALKEKEITTAEKMLLLKETKAHLTTLVQIGGSDKEIEQTIDKISKLKNDISTIKQDMDNKILSKLTAKQKATYVLYPSYLRKYLKNKFRQRMGNINRGKHRRGKVKPHWQ